MIRSLIEDLETDFCECEDGDEALTAFEECQPDWVLMDVAMKRMDGLTATRRIKAVHPEAKIIIVTNHNDAETRAAAERAGACGYVLKENLMNLKAMIRI